ncbi:SEC-C motif-containing protein [Kushneria sinocarnis]|uniref:SEC-C motif-containing protein n=1 Tax=Kushneria sinocarnis TaxID=595502 RepID=A0A420X1G5_9GAMM|nr:YchJ family protein [Kushneria sinocarnis]RKR07587.1 SEC-C motif-containing protein [Kushneria sinocarnis]
MTTEATECPCGSGLDYSDCCARYHQGLATPPDPETLMRSRYSAFALGGLGDYLLATWAPDAPGRPPEDAAMLDRRTVDWTGLEILDSSVHGAQGMVEFRAHYLEHDLEHEGGTVEARPAVLHERAQFRRSQGRWLYVDGVIDPPARATAGRNAPCPCGSGKKYKKCCGA